MTHAMNTGNTDPENIVLTAHLGSCHDHVYLLRTMIASGIRSLDFRLADSLALLKTIQGPTEPSEIASLVAKYAEGLSYASDGADSDARALRAMSLNRRDLFGQATSQVSGRLPQSPARN